MRCVLYYVKKIYIYPLYRFYPSPSRPLISHIDLHHHTHIYTTLALSCIQLIFFCFCGQRVLSGAARHRGEGKANYWEERKASMMISTSSQGPAPCSLRLFFCFYSQWIYRVCNNNLVNGTKVSAHDWHVKKGSYCVPLFLLSLFWRRSIPGHQIQSNYFLFLLSPPLLVKKV